MARMIKSQVRKNSINKQMKDSIESPMNMNYRESYAWQLGYDEGWKQAKQLIANEFKHNQEWVDRMLKEKSK